MINVEILSRSAEALLPRINAGAPTKDPTVFQFSHTLFSPDIDRIDSLAFSPEVFIFLEFPEA
jgi:hypothetical protein